ncbi:MAG: hypothetical protein R3C68_14835 [Myxococcota bacterium]
MKPPFCEELARFRNVKFPKAYQDEYRYNLAKYLFLQAERFEVERLKEMELARNKMAKSAEIDFNAFSEGAAEFDLSAAGGGGFDFGDSGGGGGFDFGADKGQKKADGFDFGSPEGGFDFGSGATPEKEPAPEEAGDVGIVREDAPKSAQEATELALGLLGEVDMEGKFGANAYYLKALLHYLNDEAQESVNGFQKVVRILNPRTGTRLDPQLREQAFLSLARIHYGHEQFENSVFYYDQIDRDAESWLTALFEASWAYYRRGDFEKALGNLLTLHSPFFEREYFPESQIVKAIIYYEACRYRETRQIVDDFLERFSKVMGEIQKVAESKAAPEQLYEQLQTLEAISTEQGDEVTTRVVSLALSDPGISKSQRVVRQMAAQIKLLNELGDEFRGGKLGLEIAEQLSELNLQRIREAGEVTRKKFEEELYALKSLLAQALRIKIEVARSERTVIEKKLRGESTADEDIIPAREQVVVDDEHLYWPYEGEFWRDELGTYELDFSMCRPLAAR